MGKFLNVLNNNGGSGCGTCSTTACGTCGPTPAPITEKPSLKLNRREMGKISLTAAAGMLLAGCSGSRTAVAQSKQQPIRPALSEELNVVQKSKGPIMTVLDEFYKNSKYKETSEGGLAVSLVLC